MIRRRPNSSSFGVETAGDSSSGATIGNTSPDKYAAKNENKPVSSSTKSIIRLIAVAIVILAVAILFDGSNDRHTQPPPVTIYINHHLHVLHNIKRTEPAIQIATEISSEDSESEDEALEEHTGDNCVPMHEWQSPNNTPWTCNSMHEVGMADDTTELDFLDCGGDRCAFSTVDAQDLDIVIKTPRYENDKYSPKDYITGWKDTIAMERLSSSPYVLDLYGNCGNSQMTEYAPGLYLYAQIKYAKDLRRDHMSSLQRLKVGYHVASAVADIQTFEIDGVPSLAHNDLCCDQYLLTNGIFKLNDFHLSSHMYKDNDGNACPEPPRGMKRSLDKTRSPESLQYRDNDKLIHRDKSDVWMMGNVLYYVLTKQWCFEGISTKKARKLLLKGHHSDIPERFLNSTDTADQAMAKAIEMAWIPNPDERPCAREIADVLKEQLVKLTNNDEGGDGLFRVNLPPFPDSFSDSSSDWTNNYQA